VHSVFEDQLAIDGGAPTRSTPFAPWPHFERDEIEAASAVLASGKVSYWTTDECQAFEEEFARFCGARYAVALANGTLALEAALHALGIGAGDEVIVTPRTFVASASSVALCGATPVFADVDADSQNITAETIRAKLTDRTRAIVAVHLAGWPCDMDPIMSLAREHEIHVIEDCAQAHGATYRGERIGSIGDVAAFSFCQDKIMTTGGEGGMLVTNDRGIWERAWSHKDHGKNPALLARTGGPPGFRYVHAAVGTNWRLTAMQAAIGRAQLRKLPAWLATRRRYAERLTEQLGTLDALRIPAPAEDTRHVYYKFYVFVRPERLREGWDRDRILRAILAEGIPCFTGSCPEAYLEGAFWSEGDPEPERLPVARQLGETSLMFMVHPTLSDDEIDDTCAAVRRVVQAASR
jgi:dTDP-4-amino-4,6-dideoxygalactose transaminase